MEKYKQVYHILQKFIHDEYEQNSIFSKNKEPLNQDQFFNQSPKHDNKLSSIEVHFCFHCIPDHLGLVQDKYIDLLCFKKENILVNDDDHEDLIRVCN